MQESAKLKEGHLKEPIPKSKKSTTAPLNILSIRLPIPPDTIRQQEYCHILFILFQDLQKNITIRVKAINIIKENIKF